MWPNVSTSINPLLNVSTSINPLLNVGTSNNPECVSIRFSVWDLAYEDDLLENKIAMNLLYVQVIQSFILFVVLFYTLMSLLLDCKEY